MGGEPNGSTGDPRPDDGASGADRSAREPLVSPATKSSALWGLVGGLAFLVLAQGYELLADLGVGIAAKVGVA